MSNAADLTFIVTFRDGYDSIEQTLDSIPVEFPVIVVDDQSKQPYSTARSNVKVIRTEQRAYPAGACNLGMQNCDTDVILMGQDNQLQGDAWRELLVKRDEYGTIGEGVFGHPAWPKGYVQATWMFMRRVAINRIGLFNAADYPAWGCTAEWQLRLCRHGMKALPTKVPGLSHSRSHDDKRFGAAMLQALKDEPQKQELLVRTPPMLTIAIPCYNYGRYLGDAINSLIGGPTCLGLHPGQTFQSFEVVIVDDCSTDNSWEQAQALADDWKAIRAIRNKKNAGTAVTINNGIKAGYGKYVTVLSADDMMEANRLAVMMPIAQQNSHSIIYDDLMTLQNGKRTVPYHLADYDFETLLHRNHVPYGIIYTRRAFNEVGGLPEIMARGREDWAMAVALGEKGYCGIHVKQPLMLYRREKQNRSLRNADSASRYMFEQQLAQLFPQLYAGRRSAMCCGNRKNVQRTLSTKNMRTPVELPGATGMVRLEFLLDRSGSMSFVGEQTHTQYVFSNKRKYGWVDAADAEFLLDVSVGRQPAFRLAPMPVAESAKAPVDA